MDLYEISGLAFTAIIVALGIVKIELIKEVVKKVTSDKENANLFSIVLIILLAIIPAVIGFSVPNEHEKRQATEVQQTPKGKSELESYIELGKNVTIGIKELSEEASIKKQREDSIFNATKPQRWVFQIGDLMDNDEAILELFKKLNNVEDVCLFKDKNIFFFFKNEEHTKAELDDLLDSFKSQVGSVIVSKVNLMSYCNSSKEKFKKTKSQKFGKRKGKIEIDCYTFGK